MAEREDRDRHHVEQNEGGQKIARIVAERRQRDAEQHQPGDELGDITRIVRGEMRAELTEGRPFRRRNRDPFNVVAVREERIGDNDDAEAEPDRACGELEDFSVKRQYAMRNKNDLDADLPIDSEICLSGPVEEIAISLQREIVLTRVTYAGSAASDRRKARQVLAAASFLS